MNSLDIFTASKNTAPKYNNNNKPSGNSGGPPPYYAHLKRNPAIELLKKATQKTYIRPIAGSFEKVKVATIQLGDLTWKFHCPEQYNNCIISKYHSAAKALGMIKKYKEEATPSKFAGIWPKNMLFATALQYDPKLGDIKQVAVLETMTQAFDDDTNSFVDTDRGLGSAIMLKLQEKEDLPGEEVEVGEFKYKDSLNIKDGKLMVISKTGKGRDTSYSLEIQAKTRDLSKGADCIDDNIKSSDILQDYTKDAELSKTVEAVLREYYGERYEEISAVVNKK